jgi:hypothetical protein
MEILRKRKEENPTFLRKWQIQLNFKTCTCKKLTFILVRKKALFSPFSELQAGMSFQQTSAN